jgi:mRNA interferase MazF
LKRGDIYIAHLSPRSGSEQRGCRPVLVVSHDGFNQTPRWRSIIVVPLSTSSAQSQRGPTAVPLPSGEGGLDRDSVALCHQITTLDRSKLHNKLGTLSEELLREVNGGIKAALDLN